MYCGWLVFVLAMLVAALAWVRIESVRRFLFALDDPRVFAVLRIGFAIMTFVCFLNLEPYWRFLWSDEGIFDLEYAQEKLGRQALRGWDPDEGFYDWWAILNFLWNKPSVLYFWGNSLDFVVGYMPLVVLLRAGALRRGGVEPHHRGPRLVPDERDLQPQRALLGRHRHRLPLLLAVPAVRQDRPRVVVRQLVALPTIASPGAARGSRRPRRPNDGKGRREPIYRQRAGLAALSVHVAARRALLLDRCGEDRLDLVGRRRALLRAQHGPLLPLRVVHAAGLGGLRHQPVPREHLGHPLVGAAVPLDAHRGLAALHAAAPPRAVVPGPRQPVAPLGRARAGGRDLGPGVAHQLPAAAVLACSCKRTSRRIPPRRSSRSTSRGASWSRRSRWPGYALGRWLVTLLRHGRELPVITRYVPWLYIPELRFEQDTLRGWLLGRRLWLTLGFIFHGFLILFMNIGMFPFIMLMTYAAFVTAEEHARIYRGVLEVMRRVKGVRRLVPRGYARWFVPAQEPTAVPVRGRRILDPAGAAAGHARRGPGLGQGAKAGVDRGRGRPRLRVVGAHRGGGPRCSGLLPPRALDIRRARELGPALAYGAVGRSLALFAVMYHSLAVGFSLLPSYPILNKWRSPAASMFGAWLRGTGTNFRAGRCSRPTPRAPTRSSRPLWSRRTAIAGTCATTRSTTGPTRGSGTTACARCSGAWPARASGTCATGPRWQCREWTLLTGEQPREIEMLKITTNIPGPDAVAEKGPYHPRKLRARESHLQDNPCTGEGELLPYTKERYGLPITEEDRIKAERAAERYARKFASRKQSWENRRDFGNWAKAAEDERKREEQAEARRLKREQMGARLAPPGQHPAAEADDDHQEQDIDEGAAPVE